MAVFKTDQILLYSNNIWGELGYGCPNFGDNPTTLNYSIAYFVASVGRNLSGLLINNPDVDLRTPPTINTLRKINRLILRARTILSSRAVAPATAQFESVHVMPAERDFILFPCPFFKIANGWLAEYAGYILACLSESMQHSENRRPYEISTDFAALVGKYLQRVYRLMSTELLLVPSKDADALDFTLTEAQLSAYDPGKFFTSTEMIDTVANLTLIPTEDDAKVLTDGIPASLIVGLQKWPSGAAIGTSLSADGSTTRQITSDSQQASTGAWQPQAQI